MMGLWWLLLLAFPALLAQPQADPRLEMWIRSRLAPGAKAVGPEVHSVTSGDRYVTIESAGLSMQSFGPLEARPFDGGNGVRHFAYRIPRQPAPAVKPVPVPLGVIGSFLNGVPIYNLAGVLSYHDQNLWHVDAVAQHRAPLPALVQALLERRNAHSPLIGFALDGYPIYGPYGWDAQLTVRGVRSSYRLRASNSRRGLPAGEELTPAQEGPPINEEFPSGTFLEDYEYVKGHGDLDEHNGLFAKTPEFPHGTYAYFLATRADGAMAYPYLIGPSYRGEFDHGDQSEWRQIGSANGLRLLTKGGPWRAGAPAAFAVASPYSVLERVHEKEMHVLLISEDLASFNHIHPEALTRQFFTGTHVFPHAGAYWIYVDHTPPGQTQTIAKFRVTVAGPPQPRTDLREIALRETGTRAVTVAGVRATLTTKGSLEAGQDISFRFALAEAATGNVIADLQPYLGAWGHILFVRKEGDEVIHAHPLEATAAPPSPWVHSHAMPGPSPAGIETVTGFKSPGLYKLWLQVQRNGTVLTFPFVLRIAAQREVSVLRAIPNAQIISVSAKGFSPARIVTTANRPIRLVFQRLDAQNCANRVVFRELGIDRELPVGKSVLIEIAPQPAKELAFLCGMGMYRGVLVVR